MKIWNIIIEAETESKVLEYINVVKEAFSLAATINQPMNHVYCDNPETKEKLTCELKKL